MRSYLRDRNMIWRRETCTNKHDMIYLWSLTSTLSTQCHRFMWIVTRIIILWPKLYFCPKLSQLHTNWDTWKFFLTRSSIPLTYKRRVWPHFQAHIRSININDLRNILLQSTKFSCVKFLCTLHSHTQFCKNLILSHPTFIPTCKEAHQRSRSSLNSPKKV